MKKPVECVRAVAGMATTAIQYTGTNASALDAFMAVNVVEEHGRHVVLLSGPFGQQFHWLTPGEWVVRGIGPGWDFYVLPEEKFRRLWVAIG